MWLVLAEQNTTRPTGLTYDQALDEARCHGWIDGRLRRRDESTFCRRFTPRGSRSPWSARNVSLVTRLISENRMHPAGMAEVERAKSDGRNFKTLDWQPGTCLHVDPADNPTEPCAPGRDPFQRSRARGDTVPGTLE
ncbi:YdeI/OmpD-associated family protein [Nocardia rhamnosiphila]